MEAIERDTGLVLIREREEADLPQCLGVAELVRQIDGYPPYLGNGIRQFIECRGALSVWVATDGSEILGHVALNPSSSGEVVQLASEKLGVSAADLGVVARLLVAPAHRRVGIGRALLLKATEEAWERSLVPILDVATHFSGSIRLYEKSGRTRLGRVTNRFPDDSTLEEFVYSAPRT